MLDAQVIVVGAGPAGSACAGRLRQRGVEVLLLDRSEFPRPKLCAGWITPGVLEDLQVTPADYPGALVHLGWMSVRIRGLPLMLPTHQYSIRREEFDGWLLARSGAELRRWRARDVRREGGRYVVDGRYRARFLVGAGGTNCPVRRALFADGGGQSSRPMVVARGADILRDGPEPLCRLWFFDHGLPGYAWYVPKGGGRVSVGLGGLASGLTGDRERLGRHWRRLVDRLRSRGLLDDGELSPSGHAYRLRGDDGDVRRGDAFLIGDAAGLATADLGEGIGPAIRSGLLAAAAIAGEGAYDLGSIPRHSLRLYGLLSRLRRGAASPGPGPG